MNRSSRRLTVTLLVLLVAGGLLGGLVGSRVSAAQGPEEDLWTFGRILALVEDEFAGDVDSKELVENAIEGMLQGLDPHSNYLSADSFSEMRDEQRGRFHGLGIQITKRGPDKPLTIIAPIDDTPADRAGLISGDVIAEIEGEPTIELTVQEAVRLLKGAKGTAVTITIERPGSEMPFQVTIERDEIPIQSLRVAYMVEPGTGVVRISNFNNTTASELDEALEQLTEQGMQRLLLDLRGNPGGLLDQAVQVAERFLPEGKRIVYTRGRIPGSDQDFVARSRDPWADLPLVVLIDGASASASEIVSGAIQDHDRGLLVGETTFGKGLVQRVIPLRSGGALAVTTAKYYTPTGRLIQRDYTDLDDYYLGSAFPHAEDEAGPAEDSRPKIEDREIFFTPSGRKVYGGGGITPDYIVSVERSPELLFALRRENLIFDFAVTYVAARPELPKGFQADEEMIAEFQEFLRGKEFEFEEQQFVDELEAISLRLRAQIARIQWDAAEEARIIAQADPQIQRALEVLGEAEALAGRSRGLTIPDAKRQNDLRAGLQERGD
jgi:carboxyl-terminal processing protease